MPWSLAARRAAGTVARTVTHPHPAVEDGTAVVGPRGWDVEGVAAVRAETMLQRAVRLLGEVVGPIVVADATRFLQSAPSAGTQVLHPSRSDTRRGRDSYLVFVGTVHARCGRVRLAEYTPRDPSASVLYTVVRDHFELFRAESARQRDGDGLPRFVEDEFRAFLRCGFLAGGFARFRCGDCRAERLVAFSCKGRGLCPSCGGRRMAERAAHLVEVAVSPSFSASVGRSISTCMCTPWCSTGCSRGPRPAPSNFMPRRRPRRPIWPIS